MDKRPHLLTDGRGNYSLWAPCCFNTTESTGEQSSSSATNVGKLAWHKSPSNSSTVDLLVTYTTRERHHSIKTLLTCQLTLSQAHRHTQLLIYIIYMHAHNPSPPPPLCIHNFWHYSKTLPRVIDSFELSITVFPITPFPYFHNVLIRKCFVQCVRVCMCVCV